MPAVSDTTVRPLTVLVTGATGKVGRHLVRHLLAGGHHVRALTRRPDTAKLPRGVDLRLGEPSQPAAVAEAARGADAAFWNWMGFDAAGVRESMNALASEVEHIVYLSAAQLQHGTHGFMPGVWADVEEAIKATRAEWTFLRAGAFAGNALEWAEAIRAGEPVLMPHPEAVRSPVHEADVAEVAWRLFESVHRGRAYEITGPEQLTRREEAEAIGEAIGRRVTVRQQDTGRLSSGSRHGPAKTLPRQPSATGPASSTTPRGSPTMPNRSSATRPVHSLSGPPTIARPSRRSAPPRTPVAFRLTHDCRDERMISRLSSCA